MTAKDIQMCSHVDTLYVDSTTRLMPQSQKQGYSNITQIILYLLVLSLA